jgi:hypothetical protein
LTGIEGEPATLKHEVNSDRAVEGFEDQEENHDDGID